MGSMTLPRGWMSIKLFEANGTRETESYGLGKADPYGIVKFGHLQQQTKVAEDAGSEPVWNQTFTADVLASDPKYNELTISLYDHNRLRRKTLIGESRIDLASLVAEKGNNIPPDWYPVFYNGKQHGWIYLSFDFTPAPNPNAPKKAKPKVIVEDNKGTNFRKSPPPSIPNDQAEVSDVSKESIHRPEGKEELGSPTKQATEKSSTEGGAPLIKGSQDGAGQVKVGGQREGRGEATQSPEEKMEPHSSALNSGTDSEVNVTKEGNQDRQDQGKDERKSEESKENTHGPKEGNQGGQDQGKEEHISEDSEENTLGASPEGKAKPNPGPLESNTTRGANLTDSEDGNQGRPGQDRKEGNSEGLEVSSPKGKGNLGSQLDSSPLADGTPPKLDEGKINQTGTEPLDGESRGPIKEGLAKLGGRLHDAATNIFEAARGLGKNHPFQFVAVPSLLIAVFVLATVRKKGRNSHDGDLDSKAFSWVERTSQGSRGMPTSTRQKILFHRLHGHP